jgi:hypothetical protein
MKKAKAAVESASVDKKREPLIRATKMNAARGRLFVDFLFVDDSRQNQFEGAKNTALTRSPIIKI